MRAPIVAAAGGAATWLLLLPSGPARADPLPAPARAVADYAIEVRLDPAAKTLDGRERIVWQNPSGDAVGELWLHLYLNAFRNSESTFVRESGGELRGFRMAEEGWGYTEVTSIRRADGADLSGGLSFEHPDDDNAADRTVLRVLLPEAVPPHGEVTLDLTFHALLPRIYARTGYVRDYFLAGQWFPKLGVYEPAGTRGRTKGGWNCHQFHASSEFYADFGHYRVEITLPSRFVVGATGKRVARRDNGDGTSTHVYEQGDVIDFAWTASPHFVEITRTFSAGKDVSLQEYEDTARRLGRTLEEVRLRDVEIDLLVQPQHRPQAERYLAAVVAGLKWYGLWLGPCPYPRITLVDPAAGALASGGMEYPTFITLGTLQLFNHWPLDRVLFPEEVTVHEFGHQYWQSTVASNEFEEPWLDEGLNTYTTGKVLERAYGPYRIQVLGLRLGGMEMSRMHNDADRVFDAIHTPAWGFSSFGSYAFNSYERTELTLRTLEGILGEQTMGRIMRTFYERWRFRHPSSEDFYAVASEVAGRDLRPFFAQTVERPGILDYEVARVHSEPVREPRGRIERDGKDVTVSEEEARKKEAKEDAEEGGRPWKSTVLVRRRGEVSLPVEIELQFDRGPAERRAWDGKERWLRLEFEGPRRLVAAVVDPDDKLVLDVNRLNNARREDPDGRAAAQWGARWVFWLQQLAALAGL